jgi:hypothetical protein
LPVVNMAYLEKAGIHHRFEHWQELCQQLGL